jgi:hypothetical protein
MPTNAKRPKMGTRGTTAPSKGLLSVRMIAGLALLVGLGAGAASMFAHSLVAPEAAAGGPGSGMIQVQQLAADIQNCTGAIDVRGVVARGTGPDGTLLLVDSREARICKSTGCAAFYLRVKWAGARPHEWDEVHLHGTVTMGARYSVFNADSLDKLGSI